MFVFLCVLDSQHIQLDENGEKVRANVKRCIIILREIPDSTPIEVSLFGICQFTCTLYLTKGVYAN